MENNQLLKGRDVARILNVSVSLAYRLISNGDISSIRFGRTVRVKLQALEEFLVSHQFGDHHISGNNSGSSICQEDQ